MTTPVRERSIVAAIMRYLEQLPDCEAEKRHGTVYGKRGQPDISGCIAGRRFEFEAKAQGQVPGPLQLSRLERWRKAGAIVGVVRSVEDVQALLAQETPQ